MSSEKREAWLRMLATEVRLAQVAYFANRTQENLIRSKGAESRLDKELFGEPLTMKRMKQITESRSDTINCSAKGKGKATTD